MIYNGIIISKNEVRNLIELYKEIISYPKLFDWMHVRGLTLLFYEFEEAMRDPLDKHIKIYH